MDIKNMSTAGMHAAIHTLELRRVLYSQMLMPISASAASSWLEAPKVFQKVFHAGITLPLASVMVWKMKKIGTAEVSTVPSTLPFISRQPVSSSIT